MTIRLLTAQDGQEYQLLFLRALQTNPEAFLTTYAIESAKPEISFNTQLDYTYSPPFFGYYGCWDDERLVGMCLVTQSYLQKQTHVAFLYTLYVDPEYRGQKIATNLLAEILTKLKNEAGIERIFLSCTSSNTVALDFYLKNGFEQCGTRPQSIKGPDGYDDEIEMVRVLRESN